MRANDGKKSRLRASHERSKRCATNELQNSSEMGRLQGSPGGSARVDRDAHGEGAEQGKKKMSSPAVSHKFCTN